MMDAFNILKNGDYIAGDEVRALRQVSTSNHDYVGIARTRLKLGPTAPAMAWQSAVLANVTAGVPRWDLELDAVTNCSIGSEVRLLARLVEFRWIFFDQSLSNLRKLPARTMQLPQWYI